MQWSNDFLIIHKYYRRLLWSQEILFFNEENHDLVNSWLQTTDTFQLDIHFVNKYSVRIIKNNLLMNFIKKKIIKHLSEIVIILNVVLFPISVEKQ